MPHCPNCLKEARQGEKKCSVDGTWLIVSCCPKCFNEVFTDEIFCNKCGMNIKVDKLIQDCQYKWVQVWPRLLAGIIDGLLFYYLWRSISELNYYMMYKTYFQISFFIAVIFYFSFFNSGNRQTIGKHVLGIVSVRKNNEKLSYLRSLIKTLLVFSIFFAAAIFCYLNYPGKTYLDLFLMVFIPFSGYFVLFLNIRKWKQTWYDKLTDIVVIEMPRY